MTVSFNREAEEELIAAAQYLEAQADGLGERFLREVETDLQYICDFPTATHADSQGIRAKVVNIFPYTLFFELTEDRIHVLAVAHHSRKPDYWRGRD